jgi:hypothetical protein
MKFLYLSVFCFLFSCADKNDMEEMEIDILVAGGSASGVAAALQAARMGIPTILVEETPWLGGMLTAAGVSAIDGNHHLPSGIWAEFRQKLYQHYDGPEGVSTGWVSNTVFEPHVGNKIFQSMVAEQQDFLTVLFNYRLEEVTMEEGRVSGAIFRNLKTEALLEVTARITIDATELGDLAAAAGVPYDLGMDSRAETGEASAPDSANNIIQDLTYVAILKDYGEGEDRTIIKPPGYDPAEFNCACKDVCDDPDFEVVDCQSMINYGKLPNKKYMINWPINGNDYYANPVELRPFSRKAIYEEAKLHTLRFIYWLQTEAGFSHLGIAYDEFPTEDGFPLIPYHRESRRIRGIVRYTLNDLKEPYFRRDKPLYKTWIAVGDYPVDHHHDKNPEAPELKFPPVPSFGIPAGTLIPAETDGLIVAEKSISVTNLVNGSSRLQPVVILIGQAAGAIAALSIQDEVQPRELEVRDIQQTLLDHQAYLMPYFDSKPDDADFQILQRIGASGVLLSNGVPFKWANQTWIYPDSALSSRELQIGLAALDRGFFLEADSLEAYIEPEELKAILPVFGNYISRNNPFYQDWQKLPAGDSLNFNLPQDVPVSRRNFARLIDSIFDPFHRLPIDYEGNFPEDKGT